jgi:hypothetical protein
MLISEPVFRQNDDRIFCSQIGNMWWHAGLLVGHSSLEENWKHSRLRGSFSTLRTKDGRHFAGMTTLPPRPSKAFTVALLYGVWVGSAGSLGFRNIAITKTRRESESPASLFSGGCGKHRYSCGARNSLAWSSTGGSSVTPHLFPNTLFFQMESVMRPDENGLTNS